MGNLIEEVNHGNYLPYESRPRKLPLLYFTIVLIALSLLAILFLILFIWALGKNWDEQIEKTLLLLVYHLKYHRLDLFLLDETDTLPQRMNDDFYSNFQLINIVINSGFYLFFNYQYYIIPVSFKLEYCLCILSITEFLIIWYLFFFLLFLIWLNLFFFKFFFVKY